MSAVEHPLRLAVGSHQAGSGKGCAMNVVSWESGDTTITDMPACADRLLARIVQQVNDLLRDAKTEIVRLRGIQRAVVALARTVIGKSEHPVERSPWIDVIHMMDEEARRER